MEGGKWRKDLEAQLSGLSKDEEEIRKKHSIFRVPALTKDASINSYEPQIVSIGPYHYGKPKLQLMERHKQRVVAKFIERTGRSIQEYIEALDPVLEDLMDAYEQLEEKWRNKDSFLPLMLIDGCFLLQCFQRTELIIPPHDPSLDRGQLISHMVARCEMLMLENQIPVLALIKLLCVANKMSFKEAKAMMHNIMKIRGEIHHLLHLFREIMIYDPLSIPPISPLASIYMSIEPIDPSATKLQEAGVVFRPIFSGLFTFCVTHITFENGVLTLPTLVINEMSCATHRNFMMFERSHGEIGNDVATYWAFMFGLANSVQDVTLLKSQRIITHQLESDEAVLNFIKELGQVSFLDDKSRLYSVRCSLNVHYVKKMEKWSRRFREWRLNLKRNYFGNPWTTISVLAAAVLLILTLIQTYYSVLSYYKTN